MILASEHIKNISNLETELGTIEFVVPDIVISELEKLSRGQDLKKKSSADNALLIVKDFKKIKISGNSVDDAIVSYAKQRKGIIATVDTDLKKRIRNFGGTLLSMTNNRIVLETSKI